MNFKVGYLDIDGNMSYIETNSFAAAAGTAEALTGKVRFILVQLDNVSPFEISHVYNVSNSRYITNKRLVETLTILDKVV